MSIIMRRERRAAGGPFPEPVIPVFPGTSMFGGLGNASPSMDSALQVSAVWACVRLVADSISMMPLHAYTLQGKARTPITPDPPLLQHPAPDATLPDWIYMIVVSLMLRGNAYGRVTRRDSQGYPVQIMLVDPDTVKIRQRPDGMLEYRIKGLVVAVDDMLHIRAYRMPGSTMGLSPIQYAARAINTDSAVADFAYGFFRDGAHPSAILSSDEDSDADNAWTIKARFMAAVKGREPAVLTGGLKYQQIQVSPEESQFLATQKWGTATIARVFGVPPEMIASEAGNSMTYANVEQRSLDFLTYSIQPWLSRLEAALAPLLPGSKHVRFDTSVLLRTDLETRMKATAIGIASHQLTPDEARELGDYSPLTPAQMKVLDLVKMTVKPTGLPSALPGSPPVGLPPSVDPSEPAQPAKGA